MNSKETKQVINSFKAVETINLINNYLIRFRKDDVASGEIISFVSKGKVKKFQVELHKKRTKIEDSSGNIVGYYRKCKGFKRIK